MTGKRHIWDRKASPSRLSGLSTPPRTLRADGQKWQNAQKARSREDKADDQVRSRSDFPIFMYRLVVTCSRKL